MKRHPKLRQSAAGQDCTLRLPGICNRDPATTVLAHASSGLMGGKVHDMHGFFACSDCHAVYDRQDSRWEDFGSDMLRADGLRAMIETQTIWLDAGKIRVA